MRRLALIVGMALGAALSRAAEPVAVATIRAAVIKAIPPLQAGMTEHNEKRACFTCHNHGVSLVAFGIARRKGIAIEEQFLNEQRDYILADYERSRPRFEKGQGPGPSPVGGETDNTGYAMLALDAIGHRPDGLTESVVAYTLGHQKDKTHWPSRAKRAPTEASPFTTTALNIRAIATYRTDKHKDDADRRLTAATTWLLEAKPTDTEDRVFRLIGLHAAKAAKEPMEKARDELFATQRSEGGWSQTDMLDSDAYATGSALYALSLAGVKPDDARWQKAIRFLLAAQKPDGTWHVKTHSKPVQKYYESGFPYENDQFISCAASAWATAALALSLPDAMKTP
jgi:N-acyl-D-amino-acid deacylase